MRKILALSLMCLLCSDLSAHARKGNRRPSEAKVREFACSEIPECRECPAKVKGKVSKDKEKNRENFWDACSDACNDDCDGESEEY